MKKALIVSILILTSSLSQASDYTPTEGLSGSQIYSETCASCHGDTGTGKFGIILKLTEATLSSEQIANKIKTGSTLMPAYPNIKAEQLLQLAEYVKSLSAN